MKISIGIERRDGWVGWYLSKDHSTLFFCPLPCVLIIWQRFEPTPDPVLQAAREAAEALNLIGAWGLDNSKRADAWVLGQRALRAIDGEPMSDEDVARFREAIPARLGGGGS